MDKDNNNSTDYETGYFLENLTEELDKGYSFTPLLGSSISFQSGVMSSEETINYLCYVYYKMFIVDLEYRWDIFSQGWPDLPNDKEKIICSKKLKEAYLDLYTDREKIFDLTKEYLTVNHKNKSKKKYHPCPNIILKSESFKELLAENEQTERKEDSSPTREKEAQTEGLKSLQSTKNALDFFSSLTKIDGCYHPGEKRKDIIISFKNFLLAKKKPNQNHYLIYHLINPLGFKRIFTTNVDTLLEEVFFRNMSPLKIINTSSIDQLPDPDFSENTSLIKINNIDPTIQIPVSENKPTYDFFSYFTTNTDVCGHLLIIGNYSNNLPVISRLSEILEKNKRIKIFIICSSEKGRDGLKEKLEGTTKTEASNRIFILREKDPSFILYEIYQKITLSLPPGGFFYQYDQYRPPIFTERIIKNYNKKEQTIELPEKNTLDLRNKKNTILGKDKLAEISSEIFYNETRHLHKSVWLEIEDHCNPIDFYTDFIRAIFYQLGMIHQEHTLIELSHEDGKTQELDHKITSYIKYLKIDPENWTLFLYAENTPGACAGLIDNNNEKSVYKLSQLSDFIDILAKKGFSVIISTSEESNQSLTNFAKNQINHILNIGNPFKDTSTDSILNRIETEIDKILSLQKIFPTINRQLIYRCLYIAILFRQSRSVSALFSEAFLTREESNNTFYQDNNKANEIKVNFIIKKLEDIGIFHRKPGGYIWINGRLRNRLKIELEEYIKNENNLHKNKSHSHFWIANWYFHGFLASANPSPLIEAFYHWFSAIDHEISAIKANANYDIKDHFYILAVSLGELCKGVRLARNFVKHWMYDENGTLNFSNKSILHALRLNEESNINNISTIFGDRDVNKEDEGFYNYIISLIKDLLVQSRNIEAELRYESGEIIIRSVKMDTFDRFNILKPVYSQEEQDFKINFFFFSSEEERKKGLISELSEKFYSRLRKDFNKSINNHEQELLNIFIPVKESISESKKIKEGQDNIVEIEKISRDLKIKFNKIKEDTSLTLFKEPYILLSIIKYFCSSCYILIKYTKLLENKNTTTHKNTTTIYWLSISLICTHCLDLLKIFWPKYHNEELNLKPKCLSMNALALAHLNQFYEAHRNINYSMSWNFNFGERQSLISLASITIRQAEIYLLEADYSRLDKSYQARKHIRNLDNCYNTLEKAENIMSASNHSSLWWGRLHILKLQLYSRCIKNSTEEDDLHSILCTKKIDHENNINDIFRKGMILAANNPIHKISLIDHYLKATEANNCNSLSIVKTIKSLLNLPNNDEEIDIYSAITNKNGKKNGAYLLTEVEEIIREINSTINDKIAANIKPINNEPLETQE